MSDTATDRPIIESETSVPAAGRAQAVALKFGKGRVLVQGEAAMLSAQISGPDKRTMGMNVPGNDNRQYALNRAALVVGNVERNKCGTGNVS